MKQWLKSRYFKTTPKQYLLTPEEIKQDEEIKIMFNEIDEDKSGMLEFDEIYQLFNWSGLLIGKSQIKDLFFDRNNNKLSLNDFLKVSKDPFYRAKFRKNDERN